MSKETSSNVIVAKIFASFMAAIHFAVIFVAITLLYTARREDSAVARLLAALGLDFWDFFKIVLALLTLYVIFVGAVVTLIAINENLMSIREDIADGESIRRQDIDSLRQEIRRIRRVMEGESPDNLEREAARRRLAEQGFTRFQEGQEKSDDSHATPSDNIGGGEAPIQEQDDSEESESREFLKKIIIVFLVLVGGLVIWGLLNRTERDSEVGSVESKFEDSRRLEDFLRKSVGKYPRTVGFFQNKEIQTRLTALLGANSDLLRRDWRVEKTISIKRDILTDDVLTAIVCGERICANSLWIKYSFYGKSFTVFWFEDGQFKNVVAENDIARDRPQHDAM